VENLVCLSRGGAGDKCDMVDNDEDHGRSQRPGAKDQGWSSTGQVLGGRMSEGLGDAVCGLHRARGDEEWDFWLRLKTKVNGLLVVWPQNHKDSFSQFDLKTGGAGFPVCASKSAATVW
jgi:hypothetical protein